MGAFQGENQGKVKAKEFFSYVTEKVLTEGLLVTIVQITSNDNTVVFEIKS